MLPLTQPRRFALSELLCGRLPRVGPTRRRRCVPKRQLPATSLRSRQEDWRGFDPQRETRDARVRVVLHDVHDIAVPWPPADADYLLAGLFRK